MLLRSIVVFGAEPARPNRPQDTVSPPAIVAMNEVQLESVGLMFALKLPRVPVCEV